MNVNAGLCNDWSIALGDLFKWFSIDIKREFAALRVLEAIDLRYEIPRYDCAMVIGPQTPTVETESGCEKILADSAVNGFAGQVDAVVTDLDGAPLDTLRDLLRRGSTIFIVVHGDNFEKAVKAIGLLREFGNVVPVTQLPVPSSKFPCIPAFSDGDKAIFIATMIARKVKVVGFDSNYQNPSSKSVELSKKLRKVLFSRAYGTLVWSRYFGELPVPDIG